MSRIQSIKNELKDARTLKLLSTSFNEISAIRLKSARQALRQNKAFYEDIKDLYQVIKVSASSSKTGLSDHPQDLVRVALTSNRRFYGSQNLDIIRKFLEDQKSNPRDALVIGLTGITALENLGIHDPQIEVIQFHDDELTAREIYSLLDKLKDYEKIFLYHPQFINLMTQEPAVTDITYSEEGTRNDAKRETGSLNVEAGDGSSKVEDGKSSLNTPASKTRIHPPSSSAPSYIYEPELEKILDFFESHVRFLLFRRSLLEVELARTSARFTAMIAAEGRAEELIKKTKSALDKEEKSVTNARLLETIAGARRWSKV